MSRELPARRFGIGTWPPPSLTFRHCPFAAAAGAVAFLWATGEGIWRVAGEGKAAHIAITVYGADDDAIAMVARRMLAGRMPYCTSATDYSIIRW